MKQRNMLSAFGVVILLGAGLSGCGILGGAGSGSNNAASKTHTISTKLNGNATASSSKKTKKPTVHYPSFGLDVSGPQVLALNERLAELGYLPVEVNAATQPVITAKNIDSPPQVSFKWRYSNIPSGLAAQWSPHIYTEMTRAAVIAVERVNGLPIDGIVGPNVWRVILGAGAKRDPHPYTYVLVTKNPAPEELRLWDNGKWVYHSIANTGVPGARSTDGTFAVYERFFSQTMRGRNPDGTKYDDPGVPYVNYYDGSEAIHGFPRKSYGWPQSVGCVELPISHAKTVWSLIHYGTLVTVEGHYVYHHVAAKPKSTPAPIKSTGGSTGGGGNTSSGGTSAGGGNAGSGTNNTSGGSNTTPASPPAQTSTGNGTGNTAGNSTGNTTNNTAGSGSGAGSNTTNTTSGSSGNTTNTGG